MGSAGDNSSFMCMAEQKPPGVGGVTGSDYLTAMMKVFKYPTVPMTAQDQPHPEIVGGVEFSVLNVKVGNPSKEIPQRYYAYVIKDYALVFIATVFDEGDWKKIAEIVSSIKVRPPR
jgi:hypothetical protein